MNRSVLGGFFGGLLAFGLVAAAPAAQEMTVAILGWSPGGGSADITMSRSESGGVPILDMAVNGTTVATLTADGLTVDDITMDNLTVGTNMTVGGTLGVTGATTFTGNLLAADAAGPAVVNEAATSTNPTLVPDRADPDTGVGWVSADKLSLIAGGAAELTLVAGTAQFATTTNLLWTTDGDSDIGASGATRPRTGFFSTSVVTPTGTFATALTVPTATIATEITSPSAAINNTAEGSVAEMTIKSSHQTHTLAAASTSDTTTITIPAIAMVLGCSFNVNDTVVDSAGDDTWSAAFVTGDTSTLATAAAAAIDTKVNTLVVPAITTDVTQVQFTANGGNFSAGIIEVVCYYIDTTSLGNV